MYYLLFSPILFISLPSPSTLSINFLSLSYLYIPLSLCLAFSISFSFSPHYFSRFFSLSQRIHFAFISIYIVYLLTFLLSLFIFHNSLLPPSLSVFFRSFLHIILSFFSLLSLLVHSLFPFLSLSAWCLLMEIKWQVSSALQQILCYHFCDYRRRTSNQCVGFKFRPSLFCPHSYMLFGKGMNPFLRLLTSFGLYNRIALFFCLVGSQSRWKTSIPNHRQSSRKSFFYLFQIVMAIPR